MSSSILHAAVIGTLFSTTLCAQFVDDFNADTSALYTIPQTADAAVTFAFDYSTVGIPLAPNTTDGTTLGLKMEANVTSGSANAVTLHTIVPYSGSYVVKFDAWLNANGPFPGGGAGSTEFLTMGVGGDGSTVNIGGSGLGGWFGVTGEGGSSRDYRLYKDGAEQFPASGQYSAGTGAGANNASDPYYVQFGGIDVGASPQGALFPSQTGVTGAGVFGFAWREVEMRVVADGGTLSTTSVSWWIDGLQIATLDAGVGSSFVTDGFVTIGYMDIFTSLSGDPAMSFGLVDNLRIGTLATATSYGSGCTGVAGDPLLTAANLPELGETLQLDATNLDPSAPISVMVLGLTEQIPPFNLQLVGFGAGCELLVSPDVLLSFPAAAGAGTFNFAIPQSNTLLGFEVFFQCGSLDSVAVGGLAVSNAIATTVGL